MIRQIRRATILVLTFVVVVGFSAPTSASDEPLLSIAKKVLRAAVGVGLDEAGSRVLGPTAWGYFKRVLTPVQEKLEEKYPKMFLSEPKMEQAIDELSNNEELQQTLLDGFRELKEGQTIILAELNRMNRALEEVGQQVTDTHAMTSEILAILKKERQNEPTESLQEVAHIIEIEDNKDFPPAIRRFMAHSYAYSYYEGDILEFGKTNATYRFFLNGYWSNDENLIFKPTEYRAHLYGRYEDDEGRVCRDMMQSYYVDGQWHLVMLHMVMKDEKMTAVRHGDTVTYCRVKGRWLFKVP